MKIGTQITLKFNIIVSIILVALAVSVYFFFAQYREDEFYARLKKEATTTAKLYSDVEEVTYDLLKIIDKNSDKDVLYNEKVLIYDLNFKLLYSSLEIDIDEIPQSKLEELKEEKEIKYLDGDSEIYGLYHTGKYGNLLIFSSAHDKYGLTKLIFLKYILIICVAIAIVITTIFGFIFAKQSLGPIANVVKEVDNITASNLNLRVHEGNGKDEIAQLASKFNKMLERLEAAFEVQRSFVANASHELRTPLTAITGQIEVAMMSDPTSGESKEILESILEDIRELNKLSNGLLDLAYASLDASEVKLKSLRIDEIIGMVRADILKRNKIYRINFNFNDYPEEENWLTINASEQLIKAALYNVIENACKYSSNHSATINLEFDSNSILICVEDSGIGISNENLQHIYEPFFRSDNAKNVKGHGIGLTLTHRIMQLHGGSIHIDSEINNGTKVNLRINHI